MQIAMIFDTHFGARSDLRVFSNYMEEYFKNEFWPEIDKRKIGAIIHGGDLFDRRKYINFQTLDRVRTFFFDELRKRKIPFYIIPGNHDVVFKNTNRLSSLNLLLQEYVADRTVKLVEEPTVFQFSDRKIGLVPWINPENYDESIHFLTDDKRTENVDVLVGHFAINGAAMDGGMVCKDGLPVSTFAKFPQVISGHFHKESNIQNIWYCGNPYEFTWSDYGQQKKFIVYDTETEKYERVLTKSNMFYKVYYDDSNEFQVKQTEKRFPEYENKYVKVIVRNKDNVKLFDSFLSKLYAVKPYDLTIVNSDIELGLSEEETNIETQSTMEIINSTIDNMNLEVPTDDLKKLFHELYNESLKIEV